MISCSPCALTHGTFNPLRSALDTTEFTDEQMLCCNSGLQARVEAQSTVATLQVTCLVVCRSMRLSVLGEVVAEEVRHLSSFGKHLYDSNGNQAHRQVLSFAFMNSEAQGNFVCINFEAKGNFACMNFEAKGNFDEASRR